LEEVRQKTGWQIHAYCLMRNHFHLAQEAKARRLLREEMDRLGWDQSALLRAGKGDKGKARIAARLRKETAMSLKWIAQNVAMGSWTHVSNLLGAKRKRDTLESEQ
jgi:REP element-mobilizing transposase RayT